MLRIQEVGVGRIPRELPAPLVEVPFGQIWVWSLRSSLESQFVAEAALEALLDNPHLFHQLSIEAFSPPRCQKTLMALANARSGSIPWIEPYLEYPVYS